MSSQAIEFPRVSVIGLGKLGAPLAAVMANGGYKVIGYDLNRDYVSAVQRGVAPVNETGLQDMIDEVGARLTATEKIEAAVTNSDVSFIIVPTPSKPDGFFSLDYVLSAIESMAPAIRTKQSRHLVVITSTVMPGATDGPIRQRLEKATGLKVGEEIGLCYNPEFIALGSVIHDMLHPDFILIGESDSASGDCLEEIYKNTCAKEPVFRRMNAVNAELCKISVNTFVTTKITYANMLADICDRLPGADVDTVTTAVGADSRIGKKYLKGAVGYGGPCFPRDNRAFGALADSLGARSDLARATDAMNDYQVERLERCILGLVGDSARVSILGVSYKPLTAVTEASQGLMLGKRLVDQGVKVTAFDPGIVNGRAAVDGWLTWAETLPDALNGCDLAVVVTPWDVFNTLPALVPDQSRLTIVDPWRMFSGNEFGNNVTLVSLGRGRTNRNAI
ncbi:nucleotide sugar dehydrogenase [Pseudokordiimonas caeni]|uniref:nucleotide sugar dehydrogenase n=1 Tax=Pseudokordiimonas caeni TaxID=2997908 RepID=UPI0028128ABB|nr:nucleotide sugar dehydrogenase [Pseudokordiimonas caeni]